MDCVVAPFDHKYDDPVLADKDACCPGHSMEFPLLVMDAVAVFMVVATGAEAMEQPLASVTVTV